MSREEGAEKECEWRRSASRKREKRRSASRKGLRVEKRMYRKREYGRSASREGKKREGVRVEKECKYRWSASTERESR